jgi:hypothetical protein
LFLLVWPFAHCLGRNWYCQRCNRPRSIIRTRKRPY